MIAQPSVGISLVEPPQIPAEGALFPACRYVRRRDRRAIVRPVMTTRPRATPRRYPVWASNLQKCTDTRLNDQTFKTWSGPNSGVSAAAGALSLGRCHRAMPLPLASQPWPVRVRNRGAARQNRRRDRPAPTKARLSPRPALLAHRAPPAATPDRRAIDRCRQRRPPRERSVRPTDAPADPAVLASGVTGSVGNAIGAERAANSRVISRST